MAFLSPFVAILSVLAALLARSLFIKWRRDEAARGLGCKPIKKYPHTLPFGLDYRREQQDAVKAGRLNKHFMEIFEKCGSTTYEIRTLTGRAIYTCEAVNIQTLAATKFDDWPKDDRRAAEPFFGSGIFSANGHHWRRARDLVNPLFKRAELSDVENIKTFTDRMIAQLPRDGTRVNIQPLLQKLFMDSSTEFVFGETIDSLRDTTGKAQDFVDAFARGLAGAGKRIHALGGLSYLYMFDKAWKEDCAKVHAFIDDRIARYLRSTSGKDASGKDASGQRQRYLLIEGMAKEIKDPVELRFQLLNVFYPAHSTSTTAVANVLFLLARNPSVWAELRKQALALGDQPITFELLKGLPLFRYTFLEGMRIHSPITHARREAARDTVLPRGGGPDGSAPAYITKGTMVYVNNFPLMRDPKIWGEDVEAFRPTRFEGKTLTWDFTPFFGGPRICPASQQVISQSVYLLVRLVREFETIENADEVKEYVEGRRMCFESRNGCQIVLRPAKND